jgi:hypothetical protein
LDSGLFSFASTTLILSLYNLQTRSITHPNVVVGMAIFCGGLAQLLAGMWEFATGNTFGATGEPRSTDYSSPTLFHSWRFNPPFDNGFANTNIDSPLQLFHPMVHSGCPMLLFSFQGAVFLVHTQFPPNLTVPLAFILLPGS